MTTLVKLPRFLLIKQFIESQINSGNWLVGARVPSENELAKRFSVSRMTARRALKELDDEGLLTRAPGLGSFVAKPKAAAPQINLPDVIEAAQAAGSHSCQTLEILAVHADADTADLMKIDVGDNLYKGMFIHLVEGIPIQFQEIYVNPKMAPAFLKQNYEKVVPEAYLDWIASPSHTELKIMATASQKRRLLLTGEDQGVCMQLTMRKWCNDVVMSISVAINPAERYSLSSGV
jgi:GntR family histidine utilization transcriptional repressor